MFIDEAKISIKAGHGGAGAASFLREKYNPWGGPDGGNGGAGGNVTFMASRGESTLIKFRYKRIFNAANGESGRGRSRQGGNGADIEITVPCGTVLKDLDTGEILCDLTKDGDTYLAAEGGIGGKGNEHFKSSTMQAPKFAQPGMPGGERNLQLELKLLADVGLVGLPNAGKSTLISCVTSAKPKIADYPFTTLSPKIGVVEADEGSFVIGDMPGLIEGAHEGKGLGDRFLKHIERTAVLCHLVDVSDPDPERIMAEFDTIQKELGNYSEDLLAKRELVLLTKIDAVADREMLGEIEKRFKERDLEVLSISSVAGENLDTLVRKLNTLVEASRKIRAEEEDMEEEEEGYDS
jgi:GTP-binding protein